MTDDYMCPFCVTPWKCNGPHIEPEDMAEFEAYSRSQYNLGFRNGLDAAEAAVAKHQRIKENKTHYLRGGKHKITLITNDEDWYNAIDEAVAAINALQSEQ